MSDAMQIAQQRLKNYTKSIVAKENEITELKELIGDLESFIEFGEALVSNGMADAPTTERQVSRPVLQTQDKPGDSDEEWGDDDEENGIAKVLAARTG